MAFAGVADSRRRRPQRGFRANRGLSAAAARIESPARSDRLPGRGSRLPAAPSLAGDLRRGGEVSRQTSQRREDPRASAELTEEFITRRLDPGGGVIDGAVFSENSPPT